ncbi:MAG: Gfo/Idh/MocA family oxidoreductase [Candidatus Nanopelagicaceae bacterium]
MASKTGRLMRAGIFGYGLAGKYFHAPFLKAAGFEVVAIQSNNAERIAQAKTDFPKATICSNSEELLSHNLDLAVVASINTAHEANAKSAIDAKVAVVVDKPMATTLAGTRELFNYAESKGVPISVYFNRLWDSDTLTIKELLNSKDNSIASYIGKPHRFDGRFERFRPELASHSWREQSSAAQGGGLLLDLQSHLISTAIDCFGPAKLKYAKVQSVRGASDDDVLLILEHQSGMVSSLSASAIAGATGPRVRLLGEHGALVIDELDPQEALLRSGNYQEGNKSSIVELHQGNVIKEITAIPGDYGAFYRAMYSFLNGKGDLPVGQNLVLQVAEIIDEARKFSDK